MARKTKEQRLHDVHQDALADFDSIQSALRDERLQCLEDRRFYSIAGAQWEGPLGEQFENKPRFEVNKIHSSYRPGQWSERVAEDVARQLFEVSEKQESPETASKMERNKYEN